MSQEENKQLFEEQEIIDANIIEVPACFANRFQVTVLGEITRLTFGESYSPGIEKYHTAVTIPTSGVENMIRIIQNTIERNKKKTSSESTNSNKE